MSRLFQITHEDIEQLNDSQLTDLLRRLLHLEAARSGIAARSVSVALNIDVPDGGEEGRIQWKKGPKNTDYIPSRLPMFQNKARDMGPKACADEMHQEHSVRLKPRIEEVLDSGGSYVLFATQSLNGRQIADRLKAMRVLASLNRGNGNPLVLAAFFGSIKENHQELVERTLDIVAHEQSLSPYLVELTRLLKPELPDLHRVLRLVQTKRIPVSDLKMFSYGSVLNHLTSTDFINFIDALLTYGGPGVWVALDILMLHRHDRRADWTTWKPQFRKILMHPELSFVDPTTLTDFSSWQDVAAKLLEEGDTELARNISR